MDTPPPPVPPPPPAPPPVPLPRIVGHDDNGNFKLNLKASLLHQTYYSFRCYLPR